MYRLVHIYLYAPNKIRDLKKCKQLLLGTYTTALSNQIQGLFADRKGTNLFNVSMLNTLFREVPQIKFVHFSRVFGVIHQQKSIVPAVSHHISPSVSTF